MKMLTLILQLSITTRHLYLKQGHIMPVYVILKKIITNDFGYFKRIDSKKSKSLWRKKSFKKFLISTYKKVKNACSSKNKNDNDLLNYCLGNMIEVLINAEQKFWDIILENSSVYSKFLCET